MRLRHRHEDADIAAGNALRRYVSACAAGRTAPEYARADIVDGVPVWTASTRAEAAGKCDGKAFKQVRRPGQPWCRWLSTDTVIASDPALQAFFEITEGDTHAWNALRVEVFRNRMKALHSWRRRGREVLFRFRAQQAAPDIHQPPELAIKYAERGKGMR